MSVAELRASVEGLKDSDSEQELSIKLLDQKMDHFKEVFVKHEDNDSKRHVELLSRFDAQWSFIQKMLLSLGGGAVAVILALLGLIGARPDLVKGMAAAVVP